MNIKYTLFFLVQTYGFIYINPTEIIDSFELFIDKKHEANNIEIYWENNKYLNYSDPLYTYSLVSNETQNGLCGPFTSMFYTNTSFCLIGNISYYNLCNLTHEVYWNYLSQHICNISNKVCIRVNIDDIFHIHKNTYKIYDIYDKTLVYEQIAFIQPEIWFFCILFLFLCCFGIYSYNVAGSKIVT